MRLATPMNGRRTGQADKVSTIDPTGIEPTGIEPAGNVRDAKADLADKAVEGVLWSISQRWVIRITAFITVVILSRLLSPTDFGVVAIALSLVPLIQLLSDFGFSTYLVQTESPDETSYSTAFWYSALAGIGLAAALALAAPWIGALLSSPDSVPIIRGMTPAAIMVTLASVPTARLRRAMRFRAFAVIGVISTLCSQIAAVTAAVLGFGAWALVAQTVSVYTVSAVLLWYTVKWRPSLTFSFGELKKMFAFGTGVIGTEIVGMIRQWLENAIVVTTLGVSGLGYLNIAQRLVQIAQDMTLAAISQVTFVVFTQMRDAIEQLSASYFRVLALSLTLITPIMVYLAVTAPLLIPLIFGSQWDDSILPAQAYAIAGILSLGLIDQGLLYALGKPRAWFTYALAVDVCAVAITWLAAPHGLVAIAYGALVLAAGGSLLRWMMVGRELQTGWARLAAANLRIAGIAAVSGVAGLLVFRSTLDWHFLVTLGLTGLVTILVYLALTRLVLPETWNEMTGHARRLTARFV